MLQSGAQQCMCTAVGRQQCSSRREFLQQQGHDGWWGLGVQHRRGNRNQGSGPYTSMLGQLSPEHHIRYGLLEFLRISVSLGLLHTSHICRYWVPL
jgi:hypothetical protein